MRYMLPCSTLVEVRGVGEENLCLWGAFLVNAYIDFIVNYAGTVLEVLRRITVL